MKEATAVRDEEHADFLVEEKDHQESVEQMGKPTNIMEAEAHDAAQTAFLQQVAKNVSNLNAAIADAAKLREDKNWKNVETLAIFNSPYTTRTPLGTEKVKP